ncbi:MAG: 50S ribosomal protein L29 [Cryomorphaceae bacterium]|nr:MAG: 50S ribosomal protein L29 [Cryomorphaceae bacterium]
MKTAEIVELTLDELKDKLMVESEAFEKLRMSHTVSSLENPLQIRNKRRVLARLRTELRKRELQANK